MAVPPDREDRSFLEAMRGVKKLDAPDRVPAPAATMKTTATVHRGGRSLLPPVGQKGPRTAQSPWVLVADGVSADMLRRLTSGKVEASAELDLHGMTRDQALDSLADFMQWALSEGMRVVSVVHGRGLHSGDDGPVLKQATYEWLRLGPLASYVLAAVPHPRSGGGSCLVALRRLRR